MFRITLTLAAFGTAFAAHAQRPPAADAQAPQSTEAIDPARDILWPAAMSAPRRATLSGQILLDRANFAPGVLDGRPGGNMDKAVAAWRKANSMPGRRVDAAMLARLEEGDGRPLLTRHTLTEADLAGPFAPKFKAGDFAAMAKEKTLGFHSVEEKLAERFHMDEPLLRELNPRAALAAGQTIVVPAVGRAQLARAVARIEADKVRAQLRVFDEAGALMAVYPATIGSTERPAPTGEVTVRAVAAAPDYTYDPSRLTFGDKTTGKLKLAPGPNNPVGTTWIDLSEDTYGIHGTPEPRLVGKRASNGCVRLTNWDAHQLELSVAAGTKVVFIG